MPLRVGSMCWPISQVQANRYTEGHLEKPMTHNGIGETGQMAMETIVGYKYNMGRKTEIVLCDRPQLRSK